LSLGFIGSFKLVLKKAQFFGFKGQTLPDWRLDSTWDVKKQQVYHPHVNTSYGN
jgi:hypothetical protein